MIPGEDPGHLSDSARARLRHGGYPEGMTRDELVNALMVEVVMAELGKRSSLDRSVFALHQLQ